MIEGYLGTYRELIGGRNESAVPEDALSSPSGRG